MFNFNALSDYPDLPLSQCINYVPEEMLKQRIGTVRKIDLKSPFIDEKLKNITFLE